MKKIIAVLCMWGMLAGMFAGCGGEHGSRQPADASMVVMKINGEAVPASLLASYMAYLKPQYEEAYAEQFGSSERMWESSRYQTLLVNSAIRQIQYEKAVPVAMNDLGLKFSEEDAAAVRDTIAMQKQVCGGEAVYREFLAQIGQTPEQYEKILTIAAELDQIKEQLYGENGIVKVTDEVVKNRYLSEYYRAKQIFIRGTAEGGSALSAEKLREKEALIQSIYEKLQAGESFDTLLSLYGEDGGMQAYPEGYTFARDEHLIPEFVNTAVLLQEGEYSGIVESSAGWHIIQRLPLDMSVLYHPQGSLTKTCIYDEIADALTDLTSYMEPYLAALSIETMDCLSEITVDNLERYLIPEKKTGPV